MRPPLFEIELRGERYTMYRLRKDFGITDATVKSWLAHGGVSARRVERFLQEREARRRMQQLRRLHGVDGNNYRSRVCRGWSEVDAATKPVAR